MIRLKDPKNNADFFESMKSLMKVLTWNVNSIRMRLHQLLNLIKSESPDVICLQETKVSNDAFPKQEIEDLDYNVYLNGAPAYNGVAILSKKEKHVKSIYRNLWRK